MLTAAHLKFSNYEYSLSTFLSEANVRYGLIHFMTEKYKYFLVYFVLKNCTTIVVLKVESR